MTQQPMPTVGDTVTVVQRITAPLGAVITAPAPADSTIATMVAPPVVTRDGDSVRIAYTLAVWAPGHSDLLLPGAVVVDLHGKVDTLAATHVPLDVRTVLPAARTSSGIPAKASRPWLEREERSDLPFAVLVPLALVLAAVVQWWWRRRGSSRTTVSSITLPPPVDLQRLAAWIDAGESRMVLDHVARLLPDNTAAAAWRARMQALRFSAGDDADVIALARAGLGLATESRPG
jgi:hypothetical protein